MTNEIATTTIFSCDFTVPLASQWQIESMPNEATIVDAPLLDGKKAFKSILNTNTDYASMLNNTGRPRAQIHNANPSYNHYPNNTYHTTVMIYLPLDFQFESVPFTNNIALLGFHQVYNLNTPLGNQNNSSPCSIGISTTKYYWNHCTSSSYPPLQYETKYIEFGDVRNDLGRWVKWDFIYKSRQNEHGSIHVYKDNIEVIKYRGQTCYSSPIQEFNYFKLGLYKWNWRNSPTDVTYLSAYFTNVSIKRYYSP